MTLPRLHSADRDHLDRPTDAASPPRLPQAAAVAVAGTLLAVALGIGRFAYTPLLPFMQETLGWSVQQAGDVASANFTGYMVGALIASVLAQRPGRRFWLLMGMVLIVLSISAGAAVTSFAAWLAIRFLAGVASALCLILGTAVVIESLTAYARPQFGALHFAGVGLGMIASVLIIEGARSAGLSLFGRWGALGLTSACLLVASWMILRRLPVQRDVNSRQVATAPHDQEPTRGLFSRRFSRLSVAYGLFGFGYVVTATFIVAMARRLGDAPLLEPLTWLIVGLAAAPSVFFWQRVAQRFGIFAALRFAYGVQAVGVLLAGSGSSEPALLLGGAFLGGTFMGITALGLSAARQTAVGHSDRAMGWITAFFGLGQLLGPAVAGRLAQMTQSFTLPSLVAAALLVIGIMLLWDIENSTP
ncbi:MAG: YbfB/YjiJ family MFS transporter [Caldilineaceae bacterium]|nr:YbfB/YjiJ family MFS transporter [Caldilineaceae bacterium]